MKKGFKNKGFKMKDINRIDWFYIEPKTKGGMLCEAKRINWRIYIGKD